MNELLDKIGNLVQKIDEQKAKVHLARGIIKEVKVKVVESYNKWLADNPHEKDVQLSCNVPIYQLEMKGFIRVDAGSFINATDHPITARESYKGFEGMIKSEVVVPAWGAFKLISDRAVDNNDIWKISW